MKFDRAEKENIFMNKKYRSKAFLKWFLAAMLLVFSLTGGAVRASQIDSLQGGLNTGNVSPMGSSGALSGNVTGCDGDVLNVRDGAWGNILGTLENGAGLDIAGEDGDWYKINYNGGTAYVYKSYVAVKSSPGAASAAGRSGTVTGSEIGLNVRDGAWGSVIGGLSDGESVTITGEDGDWYKIDHNGRTAYVYKSFISTGDQTPATAEPASAEPTPATVSEASAGFDAHVTGCDGDVLNMRDGAWGTVIGTLQNGSGVKVIGEEGDWYKIEHNGQTAYVYKEYIAKGAQPPVSNPPAAQNTGGVLDVPLVGQPDGYTCGPTSLAMALKYYGMDRSIHPELATLCNTTTDGTPSTDNLVNAAKKLGFAGSYAKSGDLNWLAQVTAGGSPVIVNVAGGVWTGGHYVVVTGVKDGTVYINDPAWGYSNEKGHSGNKITMDVNTFSSIWGARWNRAAVVGR